MKENSFVILQSDTRSASHCGNTKVELTMPAKDEDHGQDEASGDAIGLTHETLSRLRDDPFLRFDSTTVAENAYFRWLNGMPGSALDHWLAAEREEVFRQARERLSFAGSSKNGLRYAPLYAHFALLTSWCAADTGSSKRVLGPAHPRTCSICGASPPSGRFRKDAHVIPAMFGCRDLLSNEECDECNSRSGRSWENELGLLTLGDRAFAGVRARDGVPKVKMGESFIGGHAASGSTRIEASDDQIFRVVGPNTAEIKLPNPPARPGQAAKAIAKMGWLMLSRGQRERHLDLKSWLVAEDEKVTRLYSIWMAARVPTTVAVWERVDDDSGLSELIVMLAFGHKVLLWGSPDWGTGAPREILLPPLPMGAASGGTLTAQRFAAKPQERTQSTNRTVSIHFQSHRRVRLTVPVDVDVVVHRNYKPSRLRTRAVSPPGATVEKPQFLLEGGDLVGAIRIEDRDGNGAWSWSYDALPTDGNIKLTLEVLTAVIRHTAVGVTCVDDQAILLESATFGDGDDDGELEHHVQQLALMAHYVATINRSLKLQLRFKRFSGDDLNLARWLALGLTRGRFAEVPEDGEVSVVLTFDAVDSLANSMGDKVCTLSFRSPAETQYELLDALVQVGATRMVLFDAQALSSWEGLRELARRDGTVTVHFRCERIGHVFEDIGNVDGASDVT